MMKVKDQMKNLLLQLKVKIHRHQQFPLKSMFTALLNLKTASFIVNLYYTESLATSYVQFICLNAGSLDDKRKVKHLKNFDHQTTICNVWTFLHI